MSSKGELGWDYKLMYEFGQRINPALVKDDLPSAFELLIPTNGIDMPNLQKWLGLVV